MNQERNNIMHDQHDGGEQVIRQTLKHSSQAIQNGIDNHPVLCNDEDPRAKPMITAA